MLQFFVAGASSQLRELVLQLQPKDRLFWAMYGNVL